MADLDSSTCLELALEGERLCKSGDFRSGIAFFEAAVQAGCDDLKTLSAIYSQLGNAYFYLGDYVKAMSFHKRDLTLARTMNDKLGEAKASGNLGNTLKVMGNYDDAIVCCNRHLEITKKLEDKVGQARAYYNLGNAYHAKGKFMGKSGEQDPGEYPDDVRDCLQKALDNYQLNLNLTIELNDKSGEGRACGNLGNVHYLLGDFDEAILYHDKRLEIAIEFGDKNAQRRAYTNLGNAHVFSGNFEIAAKNYKKSLVLSQELNDRAVEAQACYSLGNTYTLLRDYPKAIEYHLKHLLIAQKLEDKVGEGRAFWSLGNAYSALGEHKQALVYAQQHLVLARELKDSMGERTAEMNVGDLKNVLGLSEKEDNLSPLPSLLLTPERASTSGGSSRRKSMEEMSLLRMTPEVAPPVRAKGGEGSSNSSSSRQQRSLSLSHVLFSKSNSKVSKAPLHLSPIRARLHDEESGSVEQFFELLSKCQGGRMEEQRCLLPSSVPMRNGRVGLPPLSSQEDNLGGGGNKENGTNSGKRGKGWGLRANSLPTTTQPKPPPLPPKPLKEVETSGSDDFLDLIWGMQSKRMDEQRASLPSDVYEECLNAGERGEEDDEKFFDILVKCQSSRLEEQRSVLPREEEEEEERGGRGPTVPDEDFFSLIARLQEGRMNDQRADIKDKNWNMIN